MFRVLALRQSDLKRQLFYPLWWPIYVFNSVVNTKLPKITLRFKWTTFTNNYHAKRGKSL